MNLPEFSPERLQAGTGPEWHDVAAEAEVTGRRLSRVTAAGRELFVFSDGGLRVYDSRCPHQGTNIPAEAARDDVLTCPRHGWQFDLATGQCIANGDRPLRLLEHRLEDGRLLVRW
jgi:nitrite reductase/ring-hydroxylating ferredoxin subunit